MYPLVRAVYRYNRTMRCGQCEGPLPVAGRGRIPVYCSTRCRVAAYRSRRVLPRELVERARWVRHTNKRPITPTGAPASSTDPATWSSYAAVNRSNAGDGIGFVLGAGIACIDLDHCLDQHGRPNAVSRAVLDRVRGAYVEVSPSGTGLHVWGYAPEQRGRRRNGIEVYSVGRYITVTGRVYRPGRLVDLTEFF